MHFEVLWSKMTQSLRFALKHSGGKGGEESVDEISRQDVDGC